MEYKRSTTRTATTPRGTGKVYLGRHGSNKGDVDHDDSDDDNDNDRQDTSNRYIPAASKREEEELAALVEQMLAKEETDDDDDDDDEHDDAHALAAKYGVEVASASSDDDVGRDSDNNKGQGNNTCRRPGDGKHDDGDNDDDDGDGGDHNNYGFREGSNSLRGGGGNDGGKRLQGLLSPNSVAKVMQERDMLRLTNQERKRQAKHLNSLLVAMQPVPGVNPEKLLDIMRHGEVVDHDVRDVKIVQLSKEIRTLRAKVNAEKARSVKAVSTIETLELELTKAQQLQKAQAVRVAMQAETQRRTAAMNSQGVNGDYGSDDDGGGAGAGGEGGSSGSGDGCVGGGEGRRGPQSAGGQSIERLHHQCIGLRRKLVQSGNEVRKMHRILQMELGSEAQVAKALEAYSNSTNGSSAGTIQARGASSGVASTGGSGGGLAWRGRAQTIVMLKSKVKTLEAQLSSMVKSGGCADSSQLSRRAAERGVGGLEEPSAFDTTPCSPPTSPSNQSPMSSSSPKSGSTPSKPLNGYNTNCRQQQQLQRQQQQRHGRLQSSSSNSRGGNASSFSHDVDIIAKEELAFMKEQRAVAVEQLTEEFQTVTKEAQQLKKMLDGKKARVKLLEQENSSLREKVKLLINKSCADDQLVDALRAQLGGTTFSR